MADSGFWMPVSGIRLFYFAAMYRMFSFPMFCRSFFLAAAFSFTSCMSYRELQVEVFCPAEIPIEKGKKVMLLDRNIYSKDSQVVFQDERAEAGLSGDFVRGMNYVSVGAGGDTVVSLPVQRRTELERGACPSPLPDDSLLFWAGRFGADYIVSLELQYYELESRVLECKSLVRLYEWGKSEPVDSVVLGAVVRWPEIEGEEEEPDLFQHIRAAYWDEGVACAKRIFPHWEEGVRRVYKNGKMLGMGDALWQDGQTGKAVKIWESACGKSSGTGVRARINLAWAAEHEGDFRLALRYLQEAEEMAGRVKTGTDLDAYLKRYLREIKRRIERQESLERQTDFLEN